MPRQLPNRTHGHPLPPKIYCKGDAASAIHGGLIHVSMGYTPVKDRFHTRYSPVRRSPSAYCYAMLPLDLHVLSLSLAFILSQDQTLHGMNFICFFKNYSCFVCFPDPFLGAKAGAKINTFLIPFQIFRQLFSKFFPKPLCATPEKREPPPPYPSKLSMYSCPLPKAGAKVLLTAISSKFFRHFFHKKWHIPTLNTGIQHTKTTTGNTHANRLGTRKGADSPLLLPSCSRPVPR